MINRSDIKQKIETGLRRSPVVALLGPRQCGKTTMARTFLSSESTNYFDVEDPVTLRSLDAPKSVLESLQGLVVIDEAQRQPDLFPTLRVLVDRENGQILDDAGPCAWAGLERQRIGGLHGLFRTDGPELLGCA